MRIKLQGKEYWFLGDSLDESHAIAPLEHCDEEGNIKPECMFETSYAHWYPHKGVSRFGEIIAQREDIEIIKP